MRTAHTALAQGVSLRFYPIPDGAFGGGGGARGTAINVIDMAPYPPPTATGPLKSMNYP